MSRVISKESVRRGNASTMYGRNSNVSIDGDNVSVRYRTITGDCKMTFSREKIVTEVRKAYAKVVKEDGNKV